MEIFAFHPGLNKWVEIGNSGMFRPEMLLPMGLPGNRQITTILLIFMVTEALKFDYTHLTEDVNVIAWGLSLERPTMIKYHIDNIRDLVGHKVHNHVDDQHRGHYHHHQLNMVNISISITILADFNMVIITIAA